MVVLSVAYTRTSVCEAKAWALTLDTAWLDPQTSLGPSFLICKWAKEMRSPVGGEAQRGGHLASPVTPFRPGLGVIPPSLLCHPETRPGPHCPQPCFVTGLALDQGGVGRGRTGVETLIAWNEKDRRELDETSGGTPALPPPRGSGVAGSRSWGTSSSHGLLPGLPAMLLPRAQAGLATRSLSGNIPGKRTPLGALGRGRD